MIIQGDAFTELQNLETESVDCVITSPPYWGLRDYGTAGQLGLEETPEEYVANLVKVFSEVKRVLKKEGTVWLNLGDSYVGTGNKGEWKDPKHAEGRNGQEKALNNKVAGLKSKDLVGIPWRVAFALQADGWYLRQDIIWSKPNPMPESVTDRCTKAHEYIFLLSKSKDYYYDNEAIKEKTLTFDNSNRDMAGLKTNNYEKRNKRSVWEIGTKPYKEAHFAVFPEKLIVPMVKAGCPEGGVILDPFFGSGTTGLVAKKLNRKYIGIELNESYIEIANNRLKQEILL